MALGLPASLSGCGSDDDGGVPPATATPTAAPTATPTPGTRPRELGELHFDFPSLSAGLTNLRLFALGSRLLQVLLSLHTPETRALARERIPTLQEVADELLTHFIEELDLPSDALQALWVTGTVAATGEPAVAALKLHIPQAVAQVMGDFAQAAGGPGAGALGEGTGVRAGRGQEALDLLVTPFDTAAWLVFNQQEIMNLNPGQGASICELISSWPCSDADTSCEPFLNALVLQIAQKGPATPSGGWATLVPVTDENGDPLYKTDADGNPVLDDDGNRVLVYQWDLDEEVAQTACGVGGQIKKAIFNDAQYEGTNWHPTEGVTTAGWCGVGKPRRGDSPRTGGPDYGHRGDR